MFGNLTKMKRNKSDKPVSVNGCSCRSIVDFPVNASVNPLECKGNYMNNMKLVHWPLTGRTYPVGCYILVQ